MESIVKIMTSKISIYITFVMNFALLVYYNKYIVRIDKKYGKYLNSIDFIIFLLILISFELNSYNNIYSTFISFILVYIICSMIENRYAKNIKDTWQNGNNIIKKHLEKNDRLMPWEWLDIRIETFKNDYGEIFKFILVKTLICIFFIILSYVISLKYKIFSTIVLYVFLSIYSSYKNIKRI